MGGWFPATGSVASSSPSCEYERLSRRVGDIAVIARYCAAYLGSAFVMAGLDAVWLSLTNARLYRPALAMVLAPGFRLAPAIAFYLIYLTGVMIFAVRPAVQAVRWSTAMVLGAMCGLLAYATYDLTNQATLAVWSIRISLIDMAWGTVLTGAAATAGYLASTLVRTA